MKKKIQISRRKIGIIAGIVVVAAAGIFFLVTKSAAGKAFVEEQVQSRDIQTYHSFTGTIEPVTEQDVLPDVTGTKVQELKVEEGDTVHKGDVLMVLDSTSIAESIKELEATMSSTEKVNALSIAEGEKTYNDYKSNLDNGLNSSLLQSQQAIDSAMATLVSAQKNFNDEVKLNNQGLSNTILTAMKSVDTAYNSAESAELSADQADDAVDKAQSRLDGANDATRQSLQDAKDSADNAQESANLSVSQAWDSYNNAVKSYQAAKQSEENTLTGYYDSLITAQTSYLNALDNYNAASATAQQTLKTYQLKVQEAKASADSSVNELKLADLKRQLQECEVTAPIDGTVTKLSAHVGDMTAAAASLATVTSFDKMKVDIKINEYDIQGAAEGKDVEIQVDALANKSYAGKISKISKVADVDNGVSYFTSEVDFNGDADSRAGMSVEVKLITNDVKKAVSVSSSAIQTASDGTAYVMKYAEDGKTAVQQKVTIGITDGIYTQITEGLTAGDKVLIARTAGASQNTATMPMGQNRIRKAGEAENGTSKQ